MKQLTESIFLNPFSSGRDISQTEFFERDITFSSKTAVTCINSQPSQVPWGPPLVKC